MRMKISKAAGTVFLGLLLTAFMAGCGGGNVKQQPELVAEANRLAAEGSRLFNQGCYERAERYFFQALETSRLLDDLPGIIRASNNLGAVSLARGRLPQAGDYLEKALAMNESAGIVSEESMIYGNLASLAWKNGSMADAELFWNRAIDAAEKDEQHTGLVLHLNNQAVLLAESGRQDQAEALLRRAMAEATAAGQTSALADTHRQLGKIFENRGDPEQAEQHLLLALDLDKQAEDPAGIARDLESLGVFYQHAGRWDQAAQVLDRAIFLRAALGDEDSVKRLYGLIVSNREKSNLPDNLADYQTLLEPGTNEESLLCQ